MFPSLTFAVHQNLITTLMWAQPSFSCQHFKCWHVSVPVITGMAALPLRTGRQSGNQRSFALPHSLPLSPFPLSLLPETVERRQSRPCKTQWQRIPCIPLRSPHLQQLCRACPSCGMSQVCHSTIAKGATLYRFLVFHSLIRLADSVRQTVQGKGDRRSLFPCTVCLTLSAHTLCARLCPCSNARPPLPHCGPPSFLFLPVGATFGSLQAPGQGPTRSRKHTSGTRMRSPWPSRASRRPWPQHQGQHASGPHSRTPSPRGHPRRHPLWMPELRNICRLPCSCSRSALPTT